MTLKLKWYYCNELQETTKELKTISEVKRLLRYGISGSYSSAIIEHQGNFRKLHIIHG